MRGTIIHMRKAMKERVLYPVPHRESRKGGSGFGEDTGKPFRSCTRELHTVSSMHQESSRKRYRIAPLQAKSENQGGTVHNAPLGSNTQGCFLF